MADTFRFTSLLGTGITSVFFTLVNSDLTEGRGNTIVHSVHLTNDSAEKAALGSDVQGTDGEVRESPVNVGSAGQALWGWHNVTKRRYGRLPSEVASATGIAYADRAEVPALDESQWAKYRELAQAAGRNPLAEKFTARRADVYAHSGEDDYTLFAVVTHDPRSVGHPFVVAVMDTDGDEDEAAAQFSALQLATPELANHFLLPLRAGFTGAAKWGARIKLPSAGDISASMLGRHPDGTFFFVPGTTDSYRLTGGKLFTDDGYEADLLGLVKAGLRLRTEEDVQDIAYARMEQLLSEAPTDFA